MRRQIQVGCSYDYWVSNPEPKLALFRPIVKVLLREGFEEREAGVGGGVRELDTGYMSFDAHYPSFTAMDENLNSDFAKAEDRLDGMWYDTLNFEYMEAEFEKDGAKACVMYRRGKVTVDADIEESIMDELYALLPVYMEQ